VGRDKARMEKWLWKMKVTLENSSNQNIPESPRLL
jgi:hypothetical protein